jgi:hypothetical protein
MCTFCFVRPMMLYLSNKSRGYMANILRLRAVSMTQRGVSGYSP